ncbi:hypothetical protein AVEN_100272-1 [Araneus ventricosus]|uniref:Uncharacterized protein n=1 Tax=Araneus ventricosus TaxID=182803 RepID=A0A4Y2T6G9_ARAVE|nr:hypothetical protein AVEN_100272-1 [Araneus ventricosus]
MRGRECIVATTSVWLPESLFLEVEYSLEVSGGEKQATSSGRMQNIMVKMFDKFSYSAPESSSLSPASISFSFSSFQLLFSLLMVAQTPSGRIATLRLLANSLSIWTFFEDNFINDTCFCSRFL